jgi:hypothetical protein
VLLAGINTNYFVFLVYLFASGIKIAPIETEPETRGAAAAATETATANDPS